MEKTSQVAPGQGPEQSELNTTENRFGGLEPNGTGMLLRSLGSIVAGKSRFKDQEMPAALTGGDPYRAKQSAEDLANRAWSQKARDRMYKATNQDTADHITNYVTNVLGVKDPAQIQGHVESLLNIQRQAADNPMIKMMGVGNMPLLRDQSAEAVKNMSDTLTSWGFNKDSDPTGEMAAKFGAIGEAALHGAASSNIGKRKPSDIARLLQYRLGSSDQYKATLMNPNSFIKDEAGEWQLRDNVKAAITQDVKKTIAGGEAIARIIGSEKRPLVDTISKYENGILGRKMNFDSDINDAFQLQASAEAAGVKSILPFMPATVKAMNEAGLEEGAVRYLARGLSMFAAASKSSSASGSAGGTMLDDRQINNFVKASITAPVIGNNPMVVSAGLALRRNGDQAGYDHLKKLLTSGAREDQILGFARSRNALVDPNTARRAIYTPAGESVYNDLSQGGGNQFFMGQMLTAMNNRIMSHLGAFGKGFTPQQVAGWVNEQPGEISRIQDPRAFQVANMSREIGARVSQDLGLDPNILRLTGSNFAGNMQAADAYRNQRGQQQMDNRFIKTEAPKGIVEGVQSFLGKVKAAPVKNGDKVDTGTYSNANARPKPVKLPPVSDALMKQSVASLTKQASDGLFTTENALAIGVSTGAEKGLKKLVGLPHANAGMLKNLGTGIGGSIAVGQAQNAMKNLYKHEEDDTEESAMPDDFWDAYKRAFVPLESMAAGVLVAGGGAPNVGAGMISGGAFIGTEEIYDTFAKQHAIRNRKFTPEQFGYANKDRSAAVSEWYEKVNSKVQSELANGSLPQDRDAVNARRFELMETERKNYEALVRSVKGRRYTPAEQQAGNILTKGEAGMDEFTNQAYRSSTEMALRSLSVKYPDASPSQLVALSKSPENSAAFYKMHRDEMNRMRLKFDRDASGFERPKDADAASKVVAAKQAVPPPADTDQAGSTDNRQATGQPPKGGGTVPAGNDPDTRLKWLLAGGAGLGALGLGAYLGSRKKRRRRG